MMRRILRAPAAQRPRQSTFPTALGAVGRRIPRLDGDALSALQFDRPPHSVIPSSRTFAIHGLSSRRLSSEAITSLSLSNTLGYNDFFGIHREGARDVMLSPFLGQGEHRSHFLGQGDGCPEKVFLELFKAISTLERQAHTVAVAADVAGENEEADAPSVLENGTGTHGLELSPRVEDWEEVNIDSHDIASIASVPVTTDDTSEKDEQLLDESTASPDGTNTEMLTISPEANEKARVNAVVGIAIKKEQVGSVAKIFEENRDLLSKKMLIKTFHFLLERDVGLACEVWKFVDTQRRNRVKGIDHGFFETVFKGNLSLLREIAKTNLHMAKSLLRRREVWCRAKGIAVDGRWYMTILEVSGISSGQYTGMYRRLIDADVALAYGALKRHVELRKEEGRLVDMDLYGDLINKLRYVEVQHTSREEKDVKRDEAREEESAYPNGKITVGEMKELVEDIARHLHEEYPDGSTKSVYRHLLLPMLAASLMECDHRWINACAKPLVERILDDPTFPPQLCPELFDHMMGMAQRGKTGPNYAPYHRVLTWLVSSGYRPKPESVSNVLQCHRPFADTEAVHEVLSAIKTLHSESDPSLPDAEDYRIDLGTLETISLMASAAGNIDLNLLIWDLVEMFGYQPTEGMFEDVVLSFSSNKYSDQNMFAALVDMEGSGCVPSRALLKTIALKMSGAPGRLAHAEHMLMWHENEHVRSTHTMNALLMGFGMRGNIEAAFRVFEEFAKYDLRRDENTFTFLMEALYIDTKNRFPFQEGQPFAGSPEDIEDVVGAAQIIFDSMEGAGISKTKVFYHEQIRVLCALGLLDDAKMVLDEAIAVGTPLQVASIFLLATRFAHAGNYEMAHAVADLSMVAGCGEGTNIANRIRNLERRKREYEMNHEIPE